MADLVNKRQRGNNFSVAETECLVNEVLKKKSVIENKQTDAVTWKQKEEAWKDLAETFNAINATNRTEKALKIKYDGLKRAVKQKFIKLKAEKFKTGGGTAESVQFTPWEEKLKGLILLSVEGLASRNDSDFVIPCSSTNNVENNNNTIHIELINVEGVQNVMEKGPEIDREEVISAEVILNTPMEENIVAKENISDTTKNHSLNWNSWNPASLRIPLNKKLQSKSKRAPHLTRNVNSQYSSLASSREELIAIQKKIAQQQLTKLQLEIDDLHKENVRKEEESQLRMQFARKEHEAKMEIMKLQKEHLLK